jgi:hypothetical protein
MSRARTPAPPSPVPRRSAQEEAGLDEAIRSEEEIAARAAEIRGDNSELTPDLFLKLWPLLKEPIPSGFIRSVGVTEGKPYASTGVRSEQVLIDRMNNVLTPLWWWDEVEWSEEGKVAEVTICVGTLGGDVLLKRSSRGGVNRGSTLGNVFKGSKTNAAKRAFAAIGPGHEVYLGAADLDPDTNEDAAKQQERSVGSTAPPLPTNIEGAVTLAADAVKRRFIAKEELLVRLQALGAGDTSSVTHALAGLPEETVDLVRSQLADLIAAGEEAAHA